MHETTEVFDPNRIYLCTMPFETSDSTAGEEARLRELARPCLLHPDKRRSGKHAGRNLAYYAGRAAAAALFRRFSVGGYIMPNPLYGYLEVVSRNQSTISDRFVNITHTEGLAVAALASRPVGVDIEALSRDASRALLRVATEREREIASRFTFSNSGTPGGTAALWSVKEAAGKAVGLGIKFGLRAFAIDLEGASPFPVGVDLGQGVNPPLTIQNLAGYLIEHDRYVISVCAQAGLLKTEPKFI